MYEPTDLVVLEPADRIRLLEAEVILRAEKAPLYSLQIGEAVRRHVVEDDEVLQFGDHLAARLRRRGLA